MSFCASVAVRDAYQGTNQEVVAENQQICQTLIEIYTPYLFQDYCLAYRCLWYKIVCVGENLASGMRLEQK